MKKMRKLTALLISVCLSLSLLGVAVFAEETVTPQTTPQDTTETDKAAPAAKETESPAAGEPETKVPTAAAPAETPAEKTPTEAPAEKAPAAVPSDAAVIGTGTAPVYATVTAAIAAAKDGDTVKIYGTVLWGGDGAEESVEKNVTITTGAAAPDDTQAHIVLNGANKYSFPTNHGNDDTPNVTNFTTGVTFDNIRLETSMGINFLFANGHKLVINENVTMRSNGSVCSGETSGSNVIAVGGSSQKTVASTDMTLNAGSYEYVIGGGLGQNVTGSVNLVVGVPCGEILGGGYCGNVGGSTGVVVNGKVGVLGGVYGGCYYGDVGGDTDVTVNNTIGTPGYGIVAGGSCYRGSVLGSTHVTVGANGNVGGGVYGGSSGTMNDPRPLGSGNNQRYSQKANEQTLYPAVPSMEKGSIAGDSFVTVNAGGMCNEAVYGGSSDTPVKGSTHVIVNGTVYGEGNAEGVYGGGAYVGADILGSTNVTIGSTASIPMRQVNYSYMGGNTRIGGAVFGGGRFCAVKGDTNVVVNGRVGSEGLGGLIFGGGYGRMSTGNATVEGTSNITVNAAPYSYTTDEHLGWQKYTDARLTGGKTTSIWGQTGIYGGGMDCDCDATSVININTDLNGAPVFGDGLFEWVAGKCTVNVNPGGVIYKVWGWLDDETEIEEIYKDTPYAYSYERAAGDYAKVIFHGNTSAAVQLNRLDLVQVTGASDVTIDNGKADNQQLVDVKDLTIDGKGKLTLLANASVSGNFTGDGTGTLAVPANAVTDLKKGSPRLAVGGTVSGTANLSIADNGTIKPAADQIYVTADNSKTDAASVYNWKDARNGVMMDWKKSDKRSVWFLSTAPVIPEPPVAPPVTPPDLPVIPEQPVPGVETPTVPTTPGVTIPDTTTPTTETPATVPTDIPDDSTPKAEAPKTGDNALLLAGVACAAAAGMAGVVLSGRKKREETAD